MVGQSRVHIGCQANVKLGSWRCVSQDVDETVDSGHRPGSTANHIPDNELERREDLAGSAGMMAVSAIDRSRAVGGFCPPSRLRRSGAASFAWLAEPKLTLRR